VLVSDATTPPAGAVPAATCALVPVIVTVLVDAPSVPFAGFESTTPNDLFVLPGLRPRIVTVTVWLVTPGANVNVVDSPWKSVPAAAVPFTVLTVTVVVNGDDDADSDTTNVTVGLEVDPATVTVAGLIDTDGTAVSSCTVRL
jgi:hypothetical protein